MRIISLVPSQTELLDELGLEEKVIGITKFCVHPQQWHENKTRIGGTKNLDLEKIASLQPDLIIGNKEENEKQQIEWLMERFPVWMSDIETLAHSMEMIRLVGAITGKANRATELVQKIGLEFAHLNNHLESHRPRCLYLIWNNPMMIAGTATFIHEMLHLAGFNNVCKQEPGWNRYPEISGDEINALQPDVIFLSSEPYPFQQKHVENFTHNFSNSTTLLVDGEMFSWYGSRLLQAPRYFLNLHEKLSKIIQ